MNLTELAELNLKYAIGFNELAQSKDEVGFAEFADAYLEFLTDISRFITKNATLLEEHIRWCPRDKKEKLRKDIAAMRQVAQTYNTAFTRIATRQEDGRIPTAIPMLEPMFPDTGSFED